MSGHFHRFDAADVADLVAEYPLAWLVASTEDGRPAAASLLPLLGEYGPDGSLVSLIGHLGRRNPLHARLVAAPGATVLFTGPHGYVSPAQAERRDWGPTWNYAELTISAEVTFDADASHHALAALVEAMEGLGGSGWTSDALGERYPGMADAIIAFRARVTALVGRFKLGQDEARPTFEAILRNHPDAALVRWMRRFDR